MSEFARHGLAYWFERCALVVCPPDQRHWIAAMSAEASAAERTRDRVLWLAGAAGIVLSAIAATFAEVVPVRTRILAAAGAMAACSLRALAYFEYEGLGADDDVFLAASGIAAVAFCGVALVIARAVFSRQVHASG